MSISAFLPEAAINSGLSEWGLIKTAELRFYPQIRQICEGNSCGGYGKTWACPPAVGTLDECKQKVLRYRSMFLGEKNSHGQPIGASTLIDEAVVKYVEAHTDDVSQYRKAIEALKSQGVIP